MIIYASGTEWRGPTSTDQLLVATVARRTEVTWVEPPQPYRPRRPGSSPRRDEGARSTSPGFQLIETTTLPGVTKPLVRELVRRRQRRRLQHTADSHQSPVVVLTHPLHTFPRGDVRKVLYLTDDWVAGAGLMGLSAAYVAATRRRATVEADVVLGVSPRLLEISAPHVRPGAVLAVLANGCRTPDLTPGSHPRPADLAPGAFAVLSGQINERLDLDVLDELSRRRLPLVIIGRRADRDADFGRRFDRLTSRPGVTWLGPRPAASVAPYLAAASVGLTPYTASDFNRASSPLKTLDYLAAGTPVVSTDLPASRALVGEVVSVGGSPTEVAGRVAALCADPPDERLRRTCLAEAARHTWEVRADELLSWALPEATR